MNIKLSLIALTALGGVALTAGSASAMPLGSSNGISSDVEQVRLVCDAYGRCFRTAPRRYYGGGPVVRYGYGGYRHRGWRHGRRW